MPCPARLLNNSSRRLTGGLVPLSPPAGRRSRVLPRAARPCLLGLIEGARFCRGLRRHPRIDDAGKTRWQDDMDRLPLSHLAIYSPRSLVSWRSAAHAVLGGARGGWFAGVIYNPHWVGSHPAAATSSPVRSGLALLILATSGQWQ